MLRNATRDPIRVVLGETGDGTGSYVRVTAPDRPGRLLTVCRWFADHGLSIEAADVSTSHGIARDVFLVTGGCDIDELNRALGRPQPSTLRRVVRRITTSGIDRRSPRPEMAVAAGG